MSQQAHLARIVRALDGAGVPCMLTGSLHRACSSSPENTILMKLRWASQAGGSQKQTDDALGVYEIQRGVLDERYLDEWAAALGVTDALAAIRESAGR